MPVLSRRSVLLGGAAAAVIPVGLAGSYLATSRERIVIDYLRYQLPGLAVKDADLESFAESFVDRLDPYGRRKLYFDTIFFFIQHPSLQGAIPNRYQPGYDLYTRSLLTTFLLSTDFFTDAGQKPEQTSYVMFADPYEVGCRNPIGQFERQSLS
jgi:hypothetical protein